MGTVRGAERTPSADGAAVPGSMYLNENKIKATYQYGRLHGKLPISRAKVHFLGDAGQGKTSLKRRLTGEPFNPNQEKTEGIQAKMVETKDIDHRWRSPDHSCESEYERRAAWYTVSMTDQSQVPGTDGAESTTLWAVARDMLFYYSLPLVDFIAIFLLINLGYVYSVIFLVVLMAFATDFQIAWRAGTGMTVALALRLEMSRIALKTISQLLMTSVGPLLHLPLLGVSTGIFALGISIPFGFGFRPMMSVVLCMMYPPAQVPDLRDLSWSWFISEVGSDIDMVTMNALFTVGLSTGVITYQHWGHVTRRLPAYIRFSGKTCLALFVAGVSLSNCESTSESVRILFCGCCAGFVSCIGLMTARAWSAMVLVRHPHIKGCVDYLGGTLLSLGYGYSFGWQLPTGENTSYVAVSTAIALLLVELYLYYRGYYTIPVTLIDKSKREKERGAQSFPTKLTLMDFAGDEEYYSMHHIFLAHEAVYLVIFSMAEAVQNTHRALDRLLFWLHSVKTHATSEDCAVFLVGTHRDSVTAEQRRGIARFLSEQLYLSTDFSSLLVLNFDNTPLFPVENSKPIDKDMICLRDAIWAMTQKANYVQRQLPIRWLMFLEVVKRIERPIIALDDLRQECSPIGLETEQEFYDVLTTFNEAGDIIYQANDDTLQHYVVLDPQLLVDAMAKITCPQPTHLEMPKYVEHLALLEKKGIVRADFIHSSFAQLNIDQPSVLLKLLVAYDMLCPLADDAHDDVAHGTYLVPSKLPEYNPKLHRRLSEHHDDDQVFYIDFETFKPDVVYSRIVARCLAKSNVEERTHTRTHVFRNVGCFNVANRFWFTIELMRPAPDQNVLKITVTSATDSNPFDLLGMLHNILESIRSRDFPNMSYTSGVRCPFQAPHSDYANQDRIHVLKLAGSGEIYPNKYHPLTFLCCGREYRVVLKLAGSGEVHQNEYHPLTYLCCGREHRVVRTISGMAAQRAGVYSTEVRHKSHPHSQLQFSHIQQLSLLLDPPRVLGNDWKGLADHLGYSVTEILNLERQESPTMAMLLDYGTKVDDVEAALKVKEGLELLGRPDAAAVMSTRLNRRHSQD